jgi:diguanylate cyclase (GGDEF)-like protein/PAS domain S-box-containing protein
MALRARDHARYSDLFLRLHDAVVLLDSSEFHIRDLNDAFERLISPCPSPEGRPFGHWISEHHRDDFQKMLRVCRRRYYAQTWESECDIQGRKIPVKVTACCVKLDDGSEVIQVLLRDISAEKAAEQEIRKYVKKLQVANQRLEELATTDELTQLANVRCFRERIALEHQRAQRYGSKFALIFIDADHFKHYNDRNGHPAGDELLKQLAWIIRRSCRNLDLAARYGGEEFVVLLPETDWKQAIVVAERIRRTVEGHPFLHGTAQPLGKVSVSLGVASFPADGDTVEAVLSAADQALYAAKEGGRNRIQAQQELRPGGKRRAG